MRSPSRACARAETDHRGSTTPPETFALKDYWQVLSKPELVRLFLAQFALTLGPGWMSALYLFFFTDAWRYTVQQASILLAVYIVAQAARGPQRSVRVLARPDRPVPYADGDYHLFLPRHRLAIFITPKGECPGRRCRCVVWSGAMAAGFGLMVNAMLADVGDEVRLIQGRQRISLLYAINALAQKIAAAFSILLTFPLLERLGFNPAEGAVNTPAAINNLTIAFIAGPIVFVMLGGGCVIGWRLDARRQGEIRGALDARDAELEAANGLP